MLRRILGSKWLVSGTVIAVLVGVVAVGMFGQKLRSGTTGYCAQMHDAVGMFVGNPVTIRGVDVGTVTGVDDAGDHAVVTFDVDSSQQIPATVSAATVSPSIIAVRQLALVGDYTGGATLAPGSCIALDHTSTPVSISKALESISDLGKQLTAGGGPADLVKVMGSMRAVNTELAGTGPMLNSIIKQLAVAPHTPITGGLADVAKVIDSTSSLTTGLAGNWPMMRQFISSIDPQFTATRGAPLVDAISQVLLALPETVNVAASFLSRYQHFAWPALDAVIPLARLVGAGMRNFGDLLGIVPVLIRAFTVNFDQRSLGVRITYTPPKTQVPAKNPALTCANVNRIFPGQCRVVDPGHMEIDALRAALLMTGAGR